MIRCPYERTSIKHIGVFILIFKNLNQYSNPPYFQSFYIHEHPYITINLYHISQTYNIYFAII